MNPKNDCIGQDKKRKQYSFPFSMKASIYQTALALLSSIVLMMVIGLGTAFAEKIPEETQQ